MLILGASHAYVDQLRAHGFQLRPGLGHIHLGGYSAGEAALGQVELALQVGDGGLQQLDLGVQAAQFKVVGGHFGMEAQVHVGHLRGAGLGVLTGRFYGAADAAPEVRLPTGLAAESEIAVGGRLAG